MPSHRPLTVARMLIATSLFAVSGACFTWRRYLLSIWDTASSDLSPWQALECDLFALGVGLFLIGGTTYLVWGGRKAFVAMAVVGLVAEIGYGVYLLVLRDL